MKVAPGNGRRDVALRISRFAEALAGVALARLTLGQGRERRDDLVLAGVLAVQLVEAGAVERGAEIGIVLARAAADQAESRRDTGRGA
jgi:hypothetical protein